MEKQQYDRIDRLIAELELCHHKAARRVEILIDAIGQEHTDKGYKGVEAQRLHPATLRWQEVIDALDAWLASGPKRVQSLQIDGRPASDYVSLLGEPTAVKEWQVGRVVEKLKSASRMYPGVEYKEIMEFPDLYSEYVSFRDATVQTMIRDTVDGEESSISLAGAIDHLQPCNWNFMANLSFVLSAIGGNPVSNPPFAAHARNARLNPIRQHMLDTSRQLKEFCASSQNDSNASGILPRLGTPTDQKKDLARMLYEKIDGVFQ